MQGRQRQQASQSPSFVPWSKLVLVRAVLLENEFPEEDVKDEDEEDDGAPEDGGEAAQFVAVLVQSEDVVLMSRGWKIIKSKQELLRQRASTEVRMTCTLKCLFFFQYTWKENQVNFLTLLPSRKERWKKPVINLFFHFSMRKVKVSFLFLMALFWQLAREKNIGKNEKKTFFLLSLSHDEMTSDKKTDPLQKKEERKKVR